MAAASYNMGKNGVQKARIEETRIQIIIITCYLNNETSRYVFRIIAVKEILQNPRKYGFMFRRQNDLVFLCQTITTN